MDNKSAKLQLTNKLSSLLTSTSRLTVRPQCKLKILKLYIYAQIQYEFKIYDVSLTWISETLDSLCTRHIRDWLEMPISSCVQEVQRLPAKMMGLGVPTLKDVAEKMRLLKRHALRKSPNADIQQLWSESTTHHVNTDARIIRNSNNIKSALTSLKKDQETESWLHIAALPVQGALAKSVIDAVPQKSISLWSLCVSRSATVIHNFALKALQQQLPTASNLVRWKRSVRTDCVLCNESKPQTNKHVLSNCGSAAALNRYRARHDSVLKILASWLQAVLSNEQTMYADLDSLQYRPVRDLFKNLRPDIAVMSARSLHVWELTICHESNLHSSKQYKLDKYKLLHNDMSSIAGARRLSVHTIEVSTLGFVASTVDFTTALNIPGVPDDIILSIARQSIQSSFSIYCNRNNSDTVNSQTIDASQSQV
jgi:hypothetical protein